MVRFATPAAHQAQVDFAALRLPWGRRFALMVVIRESRSQWTTSTMQEKDRQAKGRTAISREHAARSGLDGYHEPLPNDWDIKEAVPAPIEPMQLLVAGIPEAVPLMLGCFLGPAQLTILAVRYATGLLTSGIVPPDPVLDQQRRQGSGTNDRYVMLPPHLVPVLRCNRHYTWPGLVCKC